MFLGDFGLFKSYGSKGEGKLHFMSSGLLNTSATKKIIVLLLAVVGCAMRTTLVIVADLRNFLWSN